MCTTYQYVHDKSFPEAFPFFFLFFFLNFCTVNPLCRIPPLKTGNTPTCIINALCSHCSHRQWHHFLSSWLDEACPCAGLCTLDSAAHWPRKEAASWGISAQLFQDFPWLGPSSELWSWAASRLAVWGPPISLTAGQRRHVCSWVHEGKSAGVCQIELQTLEKVL